MRPNIKKQTPEYINQKSGFTLLEVLVVSAIIGLLSSIIITSTKVAKASARDARRFSDIKAIVNALSLEYANRGRFPCKAVFDNSVVGYGSNTTPNDNFLDILKTDGLVKSDMQDPINNDPYQYGYGTYNEFSGAARTKAGCGARAYLGFTSERQMKSCPVSGQLLDGGYHCHIYLLDPPPVANCFADDLSLCTFLDKATYDDYVSP